MKDCQTETKDDRVYRALVGIARDNGWVGSVFSSDRDYGWLNIRDSLVHGNSSPHKDIDTVSIDEMIEFLCNPSVCLPKIGGNDVQLAKDENGCVTGVNVGCQYVPRDTIEKIYQAVTE